MATQKGVVDGLKAWQVATKFQESLAAASKVAAEFNGLYEESATNLLARTPDLMKLLSAYEAGRLAATQSPDSAAGMFSTASPSGQSAG